MIRIRSKQNGFRRCGVAHPDAWHYYPEESWSEKELEILRAEPMLQVEVVEDPEPLKDGTASEKDEGKDKGKGKGK